MKAWFKEHDHTLSATHLYKGESLPKISSFDWLVVMGGPMGVTDTTTYPWLTDEKAFIKQAINENKIVLGICLGAQLIAEVLGAKISKNSNKEIGWFPIQVSEQAKATSLGASLPAEFDAFHWHGDTFTIPDNAILFASSIACKNQAFMIENRVLGLQFHLETTQESARSLINHCGNELDNCPYIQSAEVILSRPEQFEQINKIMNSILSYMEKSFVR